MGECEMCILNRCGRGAQVRSAGAGAGHRARARAQAQARGAGKGAGEGRGHRRGARRRRCGVRGAGAGRRRRRGGASAGASAGVGHRAQNGPDAKSRPGRPDRKTLCWNQWEDHTTGGRMCTALSRRVEDSCAGAELRGAMLCSVSFSI